MFCTAIAIKNFCYFCLVGPVNLGKILFDFWVHIHGDWIIISVLFCKKIITQVTLKVSNNNNDELWP